MMTEIINKENKRRLHNLAQFLFCASFFSCTMCARLLNGEKRLIEIASICGNSAYFRSFSHSFLYFGELSHTRCAFMVGLTLKLKRVVCNAIEKKREKKKMELKLNVCKAHILSYNDLANRSFNLVVPFVHINSISSSNVKVILTSN